MRIFARSIRFNLPRVRRTNGVLVVRRMVDDIKAQVARLDAAVTDLDAQREANHAAINQEWERFLAFSDARRADNATLAEHASTGRALAAKLADFVSAA